ncbi:hypothetical protein FPY71_00680 [Aureimonas fodinaquatilis]|uniref:histidine kinase n=1 Tax=Aureimonas fodinaquatilis TaxID=2565783 RepID=A0A5B0DY34_9HYPH|nr:ATP-binding protein [Aureimonas fodinaquatilis]KAA0971684.1 hypothetical protein FPY71_00680 [Aureimonas fodinaquatilis]
MKMLPAYSLRRRLFVWLFGILSAVWLAASGLVLWAALGAVDEADRGQTAHFATALATSFSSETAPAAEVVGDDEYMRDGVDNYFVVVRRGAQEIYRSSNTPDGPIPSDSTARIIDSAGLDWRTSTRASPNGDVLVTVGLSAGEAKFDALGTMLGVALPMLLGFAALLTATVLAVTWGLRPLTLLSEEITGRSARQLQPLSAAEAPAELQPIMNSLNDLFARLATAMDKERRFIADASHELRTPLAAIKAQLQVVDRSQADGEMLATLDKVHSGLDRATRLVEQLLSLARIEALQGAHAAELVDLDHVAGLEVAESFPNAVALDVELEYSGMPARIMARETEISVLVRNLIDNAIRHSGPGAQVVVSTGADEQFSWVQVEDSGDGMDAAELSTAFDRFWRGTSARGSGSGLGLSIVSSIAGRYGGQVSLARSVLLGGLHVRAVFPASSAD